MGALRFSPKQRQVLTWWREGSPHWEKSAIICDGAVRSGNVYGTQFHPEKSGKVGLKIIEEYMKRAEK